ncbi:hypothetical protein MRB53_040255 [Persea americana]|nr:hypothetical protein MRB53_040255 [Persea americana]
MGFFDLRKVGTRTSAASCDKAVAQSQEMPINEAMAADIANSMAPAPSGELHRGLKARHITMIAIGGAVGTGLIIGTGAALARAGCGSSSRPLAANNRLTFETVMCALGEMAAWLPMSSGFTGYASRFCDPALGFALGWFVDISKIAVRDSR